MKRLDRYVSALFARGLLLFGAACVALYITVDFFEKIDQVLADPSPERIRACAVFYALQVPLILHYLLPSVGLLAGVATMATMARLGELSALQAAGVSVRRVLLPVSGAGLALAAASFANQELVLPALSEPLQEAEEAFKKTPRPSDEGRFFNPPVAYDRSGLVVQMGAFDLAAQAMEDVTALRRAGPRRELFTARRAVYERARGGWLLQEGQLQVLEADRPEIQAVSFGPEGRLLETPITPASVLRKEDDPILLHRRELRSRIREHRGIASLQVQYYNRLSTPLTPPVLLLVGLPLFLLRRSGSVAVGILFTILVAGLFFSAQVVSAILGGQRVLSPQAAAFAPAVLFAALAAPAWARVKT